MEEVLEFELTIDREISYKDDTSWGSYSAYPEEKMRDYIKFNPYGQVSINGIVHKLTPGQKYKFKLKEKQKHPKFGHSYQILSVHQEIPKEPSKQKNFLKTIVADKYVDEIFRVYPDEDVIELFRNDKIDIDKLKGIGEVTYLRLKKDILDNVVIMDALSFLGEYGVTYNAIAKLVSEFEDNPQLLLQETKTNPYTLMRARGFSFKKVDQIALKMGYDPKGEHRIISCIKHCIQEQGQSGHSYIMIEDLTRQCVELLFIEEELITAQYEKNHKDIMFIDDRACLKNTYYTEERIAKKLLEMQDNVDVLKIDVDKFLDEEYEKNSEFKLTQTQRQFLHSFTKNSVNFLIGYAGTGKTSTQRALLALTDKLGLRVKMLAPTGRAAKLIEEYNPGRDASTIHRAIRLFDSDEDAQAKINEDVILVDESSMMDVFVADKLLEAISNKKARIVFSGDDFQLPSVQIGSLLKDCSTSGLFGTTNLTEVFRQKEGGILEVATKTRLKEKIVENDYVGKMEIGDDLVFHSVHQQHMRDGYIHYYKEAYKKFGKDGIMVLTPTKKSLLGTYEVNNTIQSMVNKPDPKKNEYKIKKDGYEVIFRDGDTVMNVVNTYKVLDERNQEQDIMNGDIGTILKIDDKEKVAIIDYGFAVISMPFSNMYNLNLAYCVTIHKSQGGSAPCTIMIADKAHTYQLNANLLYTGETRAKEFSYILTQAETFNRAMRKVESNERRNFLGELLKISHTKGDNNEK